MQFFNFFHGKYSRLHPPVKVNGGNCEAWNCNYHLVTIKIERLLAHSSIVYVRYIRTCYSCGIIEQIQSILLGIFIYSLKGRCIVF